ncbi:MAG: 3-deoxy-8-phosphooctulonate synthase [Kiritimatiellaeota bacterium]|nr:3-deoxy-8-phosphooctulonate synthase [Kiritimatiellota bacterium]
MSAAVDICPGLRIGPRDPLLVIAGPCVIESRELCIEIATVMAGICADLGLGYAFKASFDKANRTSLSSYRGPGIEQGLAILADVRSAVGAAICTDIHEPAQAPAAAKIADILQVPAFLCRQTDLLLAAGRTGRAVNIKKGQFLAPEDLAPAVEKVRSTGNDRVLVTERGTTFGYRNLVVDMRSLVIMASLDVPVVFDCTHSVQLPGARGGASGGQREFVFPLARAAVAVGVRGLFMEVHPQPDEALSDAANSLPLTGVRPILEKLKVLHELSR